MVATLVVELVVEMKVGGVRWAFRESDERGRVDLLATERDLIYLTESRSGSQLSTMSGSYR